MASNTSEKAGLARSEEPRLSTTVVIRNTFIEVCTKAKESQQKRHTMPAAVGRQTEDDSTEASDGDQEVPMKPEPVKMVLSTCAVPTMNPQPFVPLVRVPLRAPVVAGRSPLSSKAKAWTPTSSASSTSAPDQEVPKASQPPNFQEELQRVMDEVRTAVKFSGCCQDADIRWEGPLHMPVCRMTVVQQAEQWCFMERLKTTAKEAMMAAVAKSSSVFLIGCKQIPFTAMPQGFCATLSEMYDEREACWHMYNMGFCKRQGTCRWKHPQTSVAFHFDVVLAQAVPQAYVTYIPPSR